MNSTEFFRTFVAITPTDEVLDTVQEKVAELRQNLHVSGLKWEARDKWHVTLRFLGDVDSSNIPALSEALSNVCLVTTAFSAKLANVGAFPSLRRSRILWAGVEETEGSLDTLHKQVAEAISPFVQKEDEKRFRPHLTIARIKTEHRRALAQIEAAVQPYLQTGFGLWNVDNVELWRSKLSSEGSKYELLKRFPLRP